MLEHLILVLKRSPQRRRPLSNFSQQLQDPASPSYHRFLTPVQVGKKFGASQRDIDAITRWLRSQGLRVNSVANSRMMVDFSGNASLVGAAFATQMRYYEVYGEQRMATAGRSEIPTALAGVIQSVSGLNTVNDRPFHGAEQAQVPRQGSDLPALTIAMAGLASILSRRTISSLSMIWGAWNFDLLGGGQTIAIIGRAEVYDPDIENFHTLTWADWGRKIQR